MAAGMAGTLVALDRIWYAGYDRSPLHTFNDGDEWLQMDKAGHALSAYTLGAWGHALLGRCAPGDRAALWAGGAAGLLFLTGVELLDGTSARWGFSWWDMAANAAGAGLYTGQELLWEEQRLRLKFSARHTPYAAMRPELLGEGPIERYLKDYNGQTIWLSGNLAAFGRDSRLPAWFNMALGCGAEGMVTASPPDSPEAFGGDILRYRRYFLSIDADLTRIRTRSKALRTALFVLNAIKLPAPSLEFRGNGRIRGHWLYF